MPSHNINIMIDQYLPFLWTEYRSTVYTYSIKNTGNLVNIAARGHTYLLGRFSKLYQDQLELHRPGVRFAKLELSGR